MWEKEKKKVDYLHFLPAGRALEFVVEAYYT